MKDTEKISHLEKAALWCASLLLETISAVSFWRCCVTDSGYWMAPVIVFHISAGLIFFLPALLFERYRRAPDSYQRHCWGWIILFIPYIGLVGCALIAVGRLLIRSEDSLSQYQELTRREPFRELLLKEVDDSRELIDAALDIEPIRDILEGDDTALKTGAIHLLTRRKDPDSVWMLQKCLSDESDEVRYFAHLALINIEEEYAEKISRAQKRTEIPGADRGPAFKALGQIYQSYLASSLVDDKSRPYYMEQALAAFLSAREENPQDAELPLALGNISMELGNTDEAVQYYYEAMPNGECVLEAWLGILRACFEKGDFYGLAAAVAKAESICHFESSDKEKMILFEFWRSREDDAIGA